MYTHLFIYELRQIKDIDECFPYPCLNGAPGCFDHIGYYECQCAAGYTGQHCETGQVDINLMHAFF